MRIAKLSLFLISILFTTLISAEPLRWNGSNKFENWTGFRNLSGEIVDGNLVLTKIKFDCGIVNNSVNIDTTKYNAFTFSYRAENTGTRGGELFFAHLGESFTDSRSWRIPPMIPDGRWHSVTLRPDDLSSWQKGGNIVRLRFDPSNSAGGKIEISEFKLDYLEQQIAQLPVPLNKDLSETNGLIPHWNNDNNFAGWNIFNNLNKELADGKLILTVTGRDCSISNSSVKIDPLKYNAFSFRYRAEGIKPGQGELFFAHKDEAFKEKNYWVLPGLIADGQWHTTMVSPTDLSSWKNGKEIARVRFDPTNQPYGKIEISEIKFAYSDKPIIPLKSSKSKTAMEPSVTHWDGGNKFAGWNLFYNLKKEWRDDNLFLTVSGPDCRITNTSVKIDPGKYNAFTFRYRAENIVRGGELYFARPEESFSDSNSWQIPALVADGRWHTMTISPANLKAWQKGGVITKLRFDPSNGSTGTIEISTIKFEYIDKTTSAVQAQDSPFTIKNEAPDWPKVKSEIRKFDKKGEHYFQGKMIRSSQDLPQAEQHAFWVRRTFALKDKPLYGLLQFTADDCAAGFVNGSNVGFCNNWQMTFYADVTKFLQAGENVLAFEYFNDNGAGGLLCELYVQYADNSSERLDSDKTFLCHTQRLPNWNQVGFDDSKWEQTIEQAPAPARPWVTVLPYRYFDNIQKISTVSVAPKKIDAGEKVQFYFIGEGNLPSRDINFTIELSANNKLLWSENLILQKGNIVADGVKRWKADFSYVVPKYLSSQQVNVNFISDAFVCLSEAVANLNFELTRIKSDARFPSLKAQVGAGPSGLTFMLDGKAFQPLWGQPMPDRRADKKMRINDAPLDLATINVANKVWWPSYKEFDFTEFDRAAEDAARENPDAYFMWDLTVSCPKDWAKIYPQELSLTEQGNVANSSRAAFSFSSLQALHDMEQAMSMAIDYLENSTYANRIIGYRICGGETIEWLGWNSSEALDFSDCSKQGFVEFANKNYPELKNPVIPTMAERRQLDQGALLWNPQKHLNCIAYFDYYSTSMVNIVIHLTGKAKEKIGGRKLIGTYYGYTATLHWTGISQVRAHYALKKLLDADTVDFIMSPNSYPLRELGDIVGDMKPISSLLNNKIIPVIEDDTRTHMGVNVKKGGGSGAQTITEAHSIAVLRRNMGVAACRGLPFYIYPLVAGEEWDFPAAVADFKVFRQLCRHLEKCQIQRRAEIALVVSENSIKSMPMIHRAAPSLYYMQQYEADGSVKKTALVSTVLTRETFIGNQGRFCRSGAPIDILLAEDLKEHPGDYKLYVFLNSYQYDEGFLNAIDNLKNRDCTLLWLYAPGYTFNMSNHVDNMFRLTGIKIAQFEQPVAAAVTLSDERTMGSPAASVTPLFYSVDAKAEVIGKYSDGSAGIVARRVGKALSIFSAVWQLDMPFILDIAKRAGAHLYAEGLDPLEANSSLVMLHARFPGEKNIKLPYATDVVDIFNRQVVGKNVAEFDFDAKLHETRLFYYGEDAKQLLDKLNNL